MEHPSNLTYTIDDSLGIVYLTYTGHPDIDEWEATMRAVFRDPSFEPGFSFIMDRRQVTTAPSTDYIKRLIAFAECHPAELGKCRTAVVVTNAASYGMARMFQGYRGDTQNTRGFEELAEAERWLN